MKPIYIKFTDENGKETKKFSTCSIKTGVMDNIFDLLEDADKLEKGELELPEIRGFMKNLKAIIVEVFGGQFTYDELNKGVEQDEIIKVFGDICNNLKGGMVKK